MYCFVFWLSTPLKVNQENCRFWDVWIATAIGENLHELGHLELVGNPMMNEGLKMILDGCHHLELLDLCRCLFIRIGGVLGKRCLQEIKCVKLPNDFLEGCPFIYKRMDFMMNLMDVMMNIVKNIMMNLR
ncbi:putative leucine-rich repeat domain superfamily [Helianthus annuus]|nr:putative leucine-rich repeat domain superfamily [Helianthus annuus]KAJ0738511.1 putative leucine-rich repeat domain superfamily [Helianthus annuus]KAJ0741397.1 putative leucine-rich repeat domain superfamily [Helianthus annuus]KAJ0912646.1 putative leucine-rich repeat domain superfamily [Helianthus annuus]